MFPPIFFHIIAIFLVSLQNVTPAPPSPASLAKVQETLKKYPIVDTHNDIPWNLRMTLYNDISKFDFNSDLKNNKEWMKQSPLEKHTDIPRLRAGGVGVQFWSAYIKCDSQYLDAVEQTLEQIDVSKRLSEKFKDHLHFSKSVADIKEALQNGKIASLIGIEGGHGIQSSLGILRMYYELGVRYLTLTHNCNNPWADAWNDTIKQVYEPINKGLSEFGIKVVHEMNRLGMMVDIAHTSHDTQVAALKNSKAPVIFSHSGVYAKCPKGRNTEDDVLDLLVKNKGVLMMSFYGLYARCDGVDSTMEDIIGQIEHVRVKAGVDYIGFGGDYDGVDVLPKGLEDVSKYPELLAALMDTGRWNESDIEKIAHKNLMRVFEAVEEVRDQLKKDEPIQATLTRAEFVEKKANIAAITAKLPGDPVE